MSLAPIILKLATAGPVPGYDSFSDVFSTKPKPRVLPKPALGNEGINLGGQRGLMTHSMLDFIEQAEAAEQRKARLAKLEGLRNEVFNEGRRKREATESYNRGIYDLTRRTGGPEMAHLPTASGILRERSERSLNLPVIPSSNKARNQSFLSLTPQQYWEREGAISGDVTSPIDSHFGQADNVNINHKPGIGLIGRYPDPYVGGVPYSTPASSYLTGDFSGEPAVPENPFSRDNMIQAGGTAAANRIGDVDDMLLLNSLRQRGGGEGWGRSGANPVGLDSFESRLNTINPAGEIRNPAGELLNPTNNPEINKLLLAAILGGGALGGSYGLMSNRKDEDGERPGLFRRVGRGLGYGALGAGLGGLGYLGYNALRNR